MIVNELYQKLGEFIREGYGELDVVDENADDLTSIDLQKFFKRKRQYNTEIIERDIEDINRNIFEEIYENDENFKNYFVSKGKCIKIY